MTNSIVVPGDILRNSDGDMVVVCTLSRKGDAISRKLRSVDSKGNFEITAEICRLPFNKRRKKRGTWTGDLKVGSSGYYYSRVARKAD